MQQPNKFYRVTCASVATLDYDGDFVHPAFPRIELYFSEFSLLKETEKGYWVSLSGFERGKFWVSKTARKRYAYPTKAEALNAFIKRKERHVSILRTHILHSDIAIEKAKALMIEISK